MGDRRRDARVLAVVTAGTAYAAYRYDASTSDRILPGVTVGGVDVGGMKRDEAVRTLREIAEETLYSGARRGGRRPLAGASPRPRSG